MMFKTDRVGDLPKIPEDVKLWYGDTWLFHYAWTLGLKVGKTEHIRVYHAESDTINSGPGGQQHPQLRLDMEVVQSKYRWIKPYRRAWDVPEAKSEKKYSIDPASKKLLRIHLAGFIDDDKQRNNVCVGPGWPILERQPTTKDYGKVVAVVPVSRIHNRFRERFDGAIQAAWAYSHGPFSSLHVEYIEDDEHRGAGWGRNRGVERNPDADWYFFLDVDDLPKPFCFEAMNRSTEDVVWGVIEHRVVHDKEVVMAIHEASFDRFDWDELIHYGHRAGAGFNTAFFVRGEIARAHRWFERAYVYEDIEYFVVMAAHGSIERLPFPLVTIDKTVSKPFDGGHRYTADKEKVWFPVQTFWMRHGKNPLPESYATHRNTAPTMADFYACQWLLEVPA